MELTCKRCGYKWTARFDDVPKACPRCKNYHYAIEPRRKKKENKNGTGG